MRVEPRRHLHRLAKLPINNPDPPTSARLIAVSAITKSLATGVRFAPPLIPRPARHIPDDPNPPPSTQGTLQTEFPSREKRQRQTPARSRRFAPDRFSANFAGARRARSSATQTRAQRPTAPPHKASTRRFDQNLSHDLRRLRAKRHAHAELVPSRKSTREQKSGNVRARNQ